jgi:ABC-type molybdenum transport system ATPase subunit/photorepair protein PhrA
MSTVACLRSFAFPEMDIRRQSIEVATSNTCTWLHDLLEYREWQQHRHGFLWLRGKAGAGKSTLMKYALEHVTDNLADTRVARAGFFYNSRGTMLERSPLGLFRSILHQLFRKDRTLLSQFMATYEEKSNTFQEVWQWQLEELQEALKQIVAQWLSCPVFIFIDALDEGDHREARKC